MANTKISDLTAATVLADADVLPVVQGATTKKTTLALLRTLLASSSGSAPTNPNPAAQGLKAWSADPQVAQGTGVSTAADTLYLSKVLVPKAVVLTNLHIVIGATAPAGVAGAHAAVILPDGTVTRVSADAAAVLNGAVANSLVTIPLATPVTVGGASDSDFVYLAFGYDTATTTPTILNIAGTAAQNSAMNAGLAAGSYRHGTLANAVWPPVGPLTLANMAQAATPKNFWQAAS